LWCGLRNPAGSSAQLELVSTVEKARRRTCRVQKPVALAKLEVVDA
jgi:hypothetical protein